MDTATQTTLKKLHLQLDKTSVKICTLLEDFSEQSVPEQRKRVERLKKLMLKQSAIQRTIFDLLGEAYYVHT